MITSKSLFTLQLLPLFKVIFKFTIVNSMSHDFFSCYSILLSYLHYYYYYFTFGIQKMLLHHYNFCIVKTQVLCKFCSIPFVFSFVVVVEHCYDGCWRGCKKRGVSCFFLDANFVLLTRLSTSFCSYLIKFDHYNQFTYFVYLQLLALTTTCM